jgi:plastocyanin
MRTLRIVIAALALAVSLVACDSDRRAISRDDLPEVPEEATAVVEIGDRGFDTRELDVSTDDLVEFVNAGDEEHGIRTSDSSIDTGLLLPGESTLVMFDEPAEYELFDVADDSHTMTVVATAPAPID